MQRTIEALAAYDQAIALIADSHHPKLAFLWAHKAFALEALGRLEEALAATQQLVLRSPHEARAWRTRGNILHGLSRYAEAIAAYTKALEINPEDTLSLT